MNTATVTFDTLAIAEDLKTSGFNDVQAKAITQAMKNSLAAKELVTKYHLNEAVAETKQNMAALEARLTKWVVMVGILQTSIVTALLLKLIPS